MLPETAPLPAPAVAAGGLVLEADGLGKRYGPRPALSGLDLQLAPGQVHGLVGRNGAGKSTLLRMLLGLTAPDEGRLRVLGRSGGGGEGVAGFVGSPRFWPYLDVRRTLQLLCELDGRRGTDRVAGLLSLVGLEDRATQRVSSLSTGGRQRLGLAAALLRAPRLLLLDEPATGLDPAGARDLRTVVSQLADSGVAVLLSSHDLTEVADLCHTVTVLREGRTAWSGSLADLRVAAGDPVVAVTTSDDARARTTAAASAGVALLPGAETGVGLQVRAGEQALDAYVLALAREGVAVRTLRPEDDVLARTFFELTAAPA